jgi:hypothetical protein
VLGRIAVEDGEAEVRAAAAAKLTDPELLARIAAKDPSPDVRRAAVPGLGPAALATRAVQDLDPKVRAEAVARLTDQMLLARIAQKDEAAPVRAAAARVLTDEKALARASTDAEAEVRRAAVQNPHLVDRDVLARLARGDDELPLRRAAVSRLDDQGVLRAIAQDDPDALMRREATLRIADQALLGRIARDDTHEWVRGAAVVGLADRKALQSIAETDASAWVREWATARLGGAPTDDARPRSYSGSDTARQRHDCPVPATLNETFVALECELTPSELREIRFSDDMIGYHFGLGMWMRNNWGLWAGGPLAQHFGALGIDHPDNMSGVILGAVWRHANGLPVDLGGEVRSSKERARKHRTPDPARCPRCGHRMEFNTYHAAPENEQETVHYGRCCADQLVWAWSIERGWYEPRGSELEWANQELARSPGLCAPEPARACE